MNGKGVLANYMVDGLGDEEDRWDKLSNQLLIWLQ